MFDGSVDGLALMALAMLALLLFLWLVPIGLWVSVRSLTSVKIHLMDLVRMRLHRINPSKVVHALIRAEKAGLKLTVHQLEGHYLAGGNVERVVEALVAAKEADLSLSFERATAFDLGDEKVLEDIDLLVQTLSEMEETEKG